MVLEFPEFEVRNLEFPEYEVWCWYIHCSMCGFGISSFRGVILVYPDFECGFKFQSSRYGVGIS